MLVRDDPRVPDDSTAARSTRGFGNESRSQFHGPRSNLGRNLDVDAPQSQSGGNSLEQSIRPVMIPRRFVRHIADTRKLGRATRSSQQEGPVLEHRTPPPALRAADDFDAIGYDIFRIGVRKA